MTTAVSLRELGEQARRELSAAADEHALGEWRVRYLGRKGRLTGVLRSLGDLAVEERRAAGQAANQLKTELEAAFEERREQLRRQAIARTIEAGKVDVTLPPPPVPVGRLHPVTQTLRQMLDVLSSLGFSIVEGPEVELEHYNFDALRIPSDHPARDMWDTLWIENAQDQGRPLLLRTHTSPNQVRFMEQHQPPIRIAVPGRTYRYEATDPTHEWMIQQVEVLAVDEGLTMAHLKGCLFELLRQLFGRERRIRFHCSYFPFVEPGAEVSMDCFVCRGAGCHTCSGVGWIEMLGAGMVHREILANMGYDADRYTGFAAGIGVERIAMLQHGVDDIRAFYQNDLRFLEQF